MIPKRDSKAVPWTTTDLRLLRQFGELGAKEAAKRMDRSVASVKSAAQRYRISLRKRGSRRGSVLGEARGVTLPPEVREDLRSGTVDAALIAQRMILDRDADLCPYCGRRPIRVMASGLCVPCHKEILIEKHREAIDELLARRLVDRLKQQHKRLRDGGELQASEWLG